MTIMYPQTGLYSATNLPVLTSSGTISRTAVSTLLDTRWSANAISKALASGYTSQSIGSNCYYNGSNSASGNAFDLSNLAKILATAKGSTAQVISELILAATLQSLIGGLAKSVSSLSGNLTTLLYKASADPTTLKVVTSLASRLIDASMTAVGRFVEAVGLAAAGVLGLTSLDLGELLSGGTHALTRMIKSVDFDDILDVGKEAGELIAELAEAGITALIAPVKAVVDIVKSLPSMIAAVPSLIAGIASSLAELGAAAVKKVMETVAAAYEKIMGLLDNAGAIGLQLLLNRIKKTKSRSQGLVLIDGVSQNSNTVPAYAAATEILSPSYVGSGVANSKGDSLATSLALAAALGVNPPVGLGSMVSSDGRLTSASDILNMLADLIANTCAFNAAAKNSINNLSSAKDLQAAIDALLHSLECRRSSYTDLYQKANAQNRVTLQMLNGTISLEALLKSWIPSVVCPTGNGALGGCL